MNDDAGYICHDNWMDEVTDWSRLDAFMTDEHLAAECDSLLEQASRLKGPRAGYRMLDVVRVNGSTVRVGGENLSSTIMADIFEEEEDYRAAVFVATCGRELHEWAESIDDMLTRYVADEICVAALMRVMKKLDAEVASLTGAEISNVSNMNPGDLADWPLTEQTKVFKILGEVAVEVGVTLTDSLLMLPRKSVSGLMFGYEGGLINCMLCPRVECPGRRAEYQPMLYEMKFNRAPRGNETGCAN